MKRERYAAAGRATRDALQRAVTMDDDLKARDYRVLLAVVSLTASYSRISDGTSVGQLSELAGLSYARTSESLGRLHDAGVITWEGTRHRGASRVSLESAGPNPARLWERQLKRKPTTSTTPDEPDDIPF